MTMLPVLLSDELVDAKARIRLGKGLAHLQDLRDLRERLGEWLSLPRAVASVYVERKKISEGYMGVYRHGSERGHANRIILSKRVMPGAHRQLIFLHELAHHLDRELFWVQQGFVEASTCVPQLSAWREVIMQTKHVRTIQSHPAITGSARGYLMELRELFARSWAQWAMLRLDLDLPQNRYCLTTRQFLDVDKSPELWLDRYYECPMPELFDHDDFEQVAVEFDQIFSSFAQR